MPNFAYESPPTKEPTPELLKETMSVMAKRVNGVFFKDFGQKALVDDQCRLVEENFAPDYQSGPYSKGEIKADTQQVTDQEKVWAGSQRIEDWQKSKDRAKSSQLEMVITLLLHKALGDKYIVVRASTYDDYFNGVDNLIVDKKTGEVICAFDDFNDNPLDAERHEAKSAKMARKNAQGVKVKYGLTIANKKIKRQTITDTPIFLLSMHSQKFDNLLANLNFDLDADLNDTEKQALRELGELLEDEYRGFICKNIESPEKSKNLAQILKVAGELKRV